MGIRNISSGNNMPSMHMATAASAEPKIKHVQNELADVQQKMQKVSSTEELSISEKTDERKRLQKEASRLNLELKQHQEELLKAQKREILMAKLQEDKDPAKKEEPEDNIQTKETSFDKANEKNLPAGKRQTRSPGSIILQNNDGSVILKNETNQDKNQNIDPEKPLDDKGKKKGISEKDAKTTDGGTAADTGLSPKDVYAMISASSSIQQADRQGTIITQTKDGIVILKGEINQDEMRDANTQRKQDELEKMEKKEQMAATFQFSILAGANNAMKSTAEANVSGRKDRAQVHAENNAFINAIKTSRKEEQAAQQQFYLSFRY